MLRRNLIKWTLAASVAVAGVALNANKSEAFHHGWGSWGSSSSGGCCSSGGYWGCYDYGSWGCSSSGGWGCSSSGCSSSGGWGWHHAYYGSWGSSSSGGCCSSGGYYYSSCSSSGGSSSSGGVIYEEPSTPMPAPPATGAKPATPGTDVPPAPMPTSMYQSLGGSEVALLNVSVPAEAKIFVNGAATTSSGTERQYISRGLKSGDHYTYEVRAEINRDGQTVTETKTVALTAGEQAGLSFNFDSNQNAPVAAGKNETKLTLHVPADAKITLAGHDTTSTGDTREFTTTKLAAGVEWNDYTIRVVANIDGHEVTKEETIKLIGGQSQDLTIDLAAPSVASNAAVSR